MGAQLCPIHHCALGELCGVEICLLCFKAKQATNAERGRDLLVDNIIRMEAAKAVSSERNLEAKRGAFLFGMPL